ncbi:MAG: ATP-binding protein [Rhodospirillales bacterium]|jgi:anti-sigma regulatory factor (Ser/Thr protein kinase)|nr:ATP-binding protein [Rhodospirillales bacterium]
MPAAARASELRLRTAPAELARLYPWLETAARAHNLPRDLLYGMHVAVEEAVANVALHGFGPEQPGEIAVRLSASPDAAAVEVEDAGRPFDPTVATSLARRGPDAAPGGHGLTLIRHYCRDIRYERIGDRNHLTLRFPLPRS